MLWSARQSPPRGIHPGAHVGIHLCLWLYAVVVVVFVCVFIADYDYDYSYYSSYSSSSLRRNRAPALGVERAILAFLCILLAIHFLLFVRACIETNQRNSASRSRTVYVPVAVPMNSAYGSPYGFYGQPPQQPMQALPTAPGQVPVPPQQALLQGYYAPAAAHPAAASAPPATQSALYGYYAPAPAEQNNPALPPRRAGQPVSSAPSAGPSTPSPAPEGAARSQPPTVPSPVSSA